MPRAPSRATVTSNALPRPSAPFIPRHMRSTSIPNPKELMMTHLDEYKTAIDMSADEYRIARAEVCREPPRLVPVIAGGSHANTMTDKELKAALAAVGIHRQAMR